jgi:hypothetical protein
MTYNEKVKIQKEVMLGAKAPANEASDAVNFRTQITKDFEVAKAKGIALDFANDWDAD